MKVELGSGNRPTPGFVHVDICKRVDTDIVHDIRTPLPFEENTVELLLMIHTIEHLLSWRDTSKYLKDYYRVLKLGGRIRIACPNARWIARCYLEGLESPDNPELPWYVEVTKVLQLSEREFCSINGKPNPTLWYNFKTHSGQGNEFDIHYCSFDSALLKGQLLEAGFSEVLIVHDRDSLIVEGIK